MERRVNMNFNVQSTYSQATNIALVTINGAFASSSDIDSAIEAFRKVVVNPNTLVYLITDLTNIEFTTVNLIDQLQTALKTVIVKNVAYSILVASSSTSESVSRVFNIFSGRHLPVVPSIDEAHSLIAKEQAKLGLTVPKS